MTCYERRAQTALRRLRRCGTSMTVTRSTGGTYNTDTGGMTGGSTTTFTLVGVLLPPMTSGSIATSFAQSLGKELVLDRQQIGIFAASGATEPLPGDTINSLWTVVASQALSPAGTPLVYQAFLER